VDRSKFEEVGNFVRCFDEVLKLFRNGGVKDDAQKMLLKLSHLGLLHHIVQRGLLGKDVVEFLHKEGLVADHTMTSKIVSSYWKEVAIYEESHEKRLQAIEEEKDKRAHKTELKQKTRSLLKGWVQNPLLHAHNYVDLDIKDDSTEIFPIVNEWTKALEGRHSLHIARVYKRAMGDKMIDRQLKLKFKQTMDLLIMESCKKLDWEPLRDLIEAKPHFGVNECLGYAVLNSDENELNRTEDFIKVFVSLVSRTPKIKFDRDLAFKSVFKKAFKQRMWKTCNMLSRIRSRDLPYTNT
jgi:hypothetical protein